MSKETEFAISWTNVNYYGIYKFIPLLTLSAYSKHDRNLICDFDFRTMKIETCLSMMKRNIFCFKDSKYKRLKF
jgi:hypothetical protein